MEQSTELITLDLDESNELAFKIKVEGIAPTAAKVRLVCESGDLSYMFNGHATGEIDVIQFVLPQMKDKLVEGTYPAKVEVLIDNRYFSPVQFQINFKKTITVVAESMTIVPRKIPTEVTVTASPIAAVRKQKPVITPAQTQTLPIVNKVNSHYSSLNEGYKAKKNR